MSERYQTSTGRNVSAAFRRFFANPTSFRYRMERGMLRVAGVLDHLVLRLRAARLARDWAVRKLR